LEKEAYEISEKTLNEILPEAFAVIKETAKRFKENTYCKSHCNCKRQRTFFNKNLHYTRR
jgi:hypothetical protein